MVTTNENLVSERSPVFAALLEKLSPTRFPGMSGKMVAIVSCILGQSWTDPALAELIVTSDGFVLGRNTGEEGANTFIGTYDELRSNWTKLLKAAELNVFERASAEALFTEAVTRM